MSHEEGGDKDGETIEMARETMRLYTRSAADAGLDIDTYMPYRDYRYAKLIVSLVDTPRSSVAEIEREVLAESKEELALADKIEKTVKGTQFDPFLNDADWKAIIRALRGQALVSAIGEWKKASEQHPAPHAQYQMRRDGMVYTVTPCYGMHAPWWVGRVLGGHESEPVRIEPTDEWMPLTQEPSAYVESPVKAAPHWSDDEGMQ